MKKLIFKKGFTVLETIIAITMMASVIGAVSLVVKNNINSLSIAKEEVRAFYFTQEAIEIIRNRRDYNQLAYLLGGSSNWLSGITSPNATFPSWGSCAVGSVCTVDVYNNIISACSGSWGTCLPLKQNSSSQPAAYIYGYNAGWTVTPYTREIQIESISADQISLSVKITWTHAGVTKTFKTKTLLTNWF
jgi:type II secretory pathway pseudopilin PulG